MRERSRIRHFLFGRRLWIGQGAVNSKGYDECAEP